MVEQTANSKQQTANSKQQTANSKQQTANSKQHESASVTRGWIVDKHNRVFKSPKLGKMIILPSFGLF